jgi:hypothetical protein
MSYELLDLLHLQIYYDSRWAVTIRSAKCRAVYVCRGWRWILCVVYEHRIGLAIGCRLPGLAARPARKKAETQKPQPPDFNGSIWRGGAGGDSFSFVFPRLHEGQGRGGRNIQFPMESIDLFRILGGGFLRGCPSSNSLYSSGGGLTFLGFAKSSFSELRRN